MVEGFKNTELGVIPNDWEVKTLGDIAQINMGQSPDSKFYKSYKIGLPLIQGNADLKNKKQLIRFWSSQITKTCDEGDIIMTVRAPVGAIGLSTERSCIGRGVCSLKANNIEKSFLYFSLEFKESEWKVLEQGSTFTAANSNQIKGFQIPLPPTLAEQTAIATALNDADALISSLEKLIAKKKSIKQGAMQELLKPKEGWEENTLGEVATLKARIGWQGLTTAEYRKTGSYFLITGTEFKNGFIDWECCNYVDESRYNQDKNIQVKPNDVLVTKDGTIGKVALIKSVPKPATLNSGVFVIRPIKDSFDPEFFYYLLLSDVFKVFLSQLSAGSTIIHLYQKDFVTFKFFTPKSLDEQKIIAEVLSDMDNEILILEGKLKKQKQLKQGMMQSLLTGKIRLV